MTTQTPTPGAIAASHTSATAAGEAALRAGGNALDAALAAAAALCVVYPNNVALGGDLVALVRSPDGAVRFVNATGTAPAQQSVAALRERHGDALPLRDIDTVTVPGGVRGWEMLRGLGARLSWADQLAPAIELAERGVPLARSVARAVVELREQLAADPGCAAVFLPGGVPLPEGGHFAQPALAETLRAMQLGGPDEFYTGAVAERWIAGLAALGSRISAADAAGYAAELGEPIEAACGPYRVLTSPPNTQGFSLLRTIQAANELPGADLLGADAGTLARLFARNNAVRDAHLADPRFGGLTAEELIRMDPPEDLLDEFKGRATGDTVGISAISADGWAVSLIQSVYHGFGAAILEPETGILFQNRGTSFSLADGSPNVFAPGKRPRHTLMPVLVLRGDDVAWVSATMGGQAQPQVHAQLLLRSFAGATPAEATAAPRFSVDAQKLGDPAETLVMEADLDAAARASLDRTGFVPAPFPAHSEKLGHSNLIRVEPDGGFSAASDPRSDGSAAVVTG